MQPHNTQTCGDLTDTILTTYILHHTLAPGLPHTHRVGCLINLGNIRGLYECSFVSITCDRCITQFYRCTFQCDCYKITKHPYLSRLRMVRCECKAQNSVVSTGTVQYRGCTRLVRLDWFWVQPRQTGSWQLAVVQTTSTVISPLP